MKTKTKILLVVILLIVITIPIFTFAATGRVGIVPVPEGKELPSKYTMELFGKLIFSIIEYAINLALIVSSLAFAWVGFLYMTSSNNPSKRKDANKILMNVVVGFLLAVSAFLIVRIISQDIFNVKQPVQNIIQKYFRR